MIGIKRTPFKGSVTPKHGWGEVHHCEKLPGQIVKQYKNNYSKLTTASSLGISPSILHNIIKGFRESR